MQLQVIKGKKESGNEFFKIDIRQLKDSCLIKLFDEMVRINVDDERKAISPFAVVEQWHLNGTKKISVYYTNK